jgi:uncharacterized membrane protein YsdA (DUF1294 family)
MTRFGGMVVLAAIGLAAVVGLLLVFAGLSALRAMFVGVNVATMLCYGYDKYVAQARGRRVPEAALHILAAAGGTPGAFVGQLLFQHKTRDRRFRVVFFAIAAVQVVALLAIARLRGG